MSGHPMPSDTEFAASETGRLRRLPREHATPRSDATAVASSAAPRVTDEARIEGSGPRSLARVQVT